MNKQDFINVLRLINGCVAAILLISIVILLATQSKLTIESWYKNHSNLVFSVCVCLWIALILPPFKSK